MRSFMIIRVNESCYTKYSKELLRLMCDIMRCVPITLMHPLAHPTLESNRRHPIRGLTKVH